MSSATNHAAPTAVPTTHHTITAFFAPNTFDACLACAINQVATPIGTAPEYITEEAVVFNGNMPAPDLIGELITAGYKTVRIMCEAPQKSYIHDGAVVAYFAPADFYDNVAVGNPSAMYLVEHILCGLYDCTSSLDVKPGAAQNVLTALEALTIDKIPDLLRRILSVRGFDVVDNLVIIGGARDQYAMQLVADRLAQYGVFGVSCGDKILTMMYVNALDLSVTNLIEFWAAGERATNSKDGRCDDRVLMLYDHSIRTGAGDVEIGWQITLASLTEQTSSDTLRLILSYCGADFADAAISETHGDITVVSVWMPAANASVLMPFIYKL